MIDTTQVGLHFEKANMAAEMVERGKDHVLLGAVTAGVELNAAKAIVPHGEWSAWLGKHWDYSHSLANKYMKIANSERVTNLTEAKSVRQALAMAAVAESVFEEEQAETPRSKRKLGQVVVSKPAPNEVSSETEQQPAQPDNENILTNCNTRGEFRGHSHECGDVKPEPKTNTRHTPSTAKAKEAERETPPIITPVIIEEVQQVPEPPTLSDWPVSEIIRFLKSSADEPKKRAKELRKAADELDPPKKLRTPDLDECLEFFQLLNSDQGEQFFDFYQSKGWLVGKAPMKDWQAAGRRWIRENEKGTFSNGNGQPRLTTTQQREQNTATAFDRFRQAAADAARIGDRGDVPRRIGAAGVIETDAGAD